VTIRRLDIAGFDEESQRATIAVECSKGTYVRQIAADLGEATRAGAYCLELRRTGVGGFDVSAAASPAGVLDDPAGPWFLRPVSALPHLPARELGSEEADAAAHGRGLELRGETGPVRLVADEELLGVGEPRHGRLRPVVVLR
jgi:tRNA pseudouridine55 synthase